jgi:hypothetical protein
VESHSRFVIAPHAITIECGKMSEILELVLELLFDLAGSVLGAIAEIWLSDWSWPDTKAKRIFWCVVLVLIVGAIWWDFR